VARIVRKRIRRSVDGVNLVADVNAVVATSSATNVGTGATSRQSVRIVQKDGRTEVTEERSEG